MSPQEAPDPFERLTRAAEGDEDEDPPSPGDLPDTPENRQATARAYGNDPTNIEEREERLKEMEVQEPPPPEEQEADPFEQLQQAAGEAPEPEVEEEAEQEGPDPFERLETAAEGPDREALLEAAPDLEGSAAARASTAVQPKPASGSVLEGVAPDAAQMRREQLEEAIVGPSRREQLMGGADFRARLEQWRLNRSEEIARRIVQPPDFEDLTQQEAEQSREQAVVRPQTGGGLPGPEKSFGEKSQIWLESGVQVMNLAPAVAIEETGEAAGMVSGAIGDVIGSGQADRKFWKNIQDYGERLRETAGREMAKAARTEPSNFGEYAVRTVLQTLPMTLTAVASGGTTAALTTGGYAAAMTGAFGAFYPMSKGMLQNDLEEAGLSEEEADIWSSAAAVPIAAAESAFEAALGSGGQRVLSRPLRNTFVDRVAAMAKSSATGTVVESATETVQNAMEMGTVAAATGKVPSARQIASRLGESAKAGAVAGGVLGGGFGTMTDVGTTSERVVEAMHQEFTANLNDQELGRQLQVTRESEAGEQLQQRLRNEARDRGLDPDELVEQVEEQQEAAEEAEAEPAAQEAADDARQREMEDPVEAAEAEDLTASEDRAREVLENLREPVRQGEATPQEVQRFERAQEFLSDRRGPAIEPTEQQAQDHDQLHDPDMSDANRMLQDRDPLDPSTVPENIEGISRVKPQIGDRLRGNLERPPDWEGGSISRPQVMNELTKVAEAAGGKVPFRVGRTPPGARGSFKVHPEVVRIQTADNLATSSHELAHAIDKLVYGYPEEAPFTEERVGQEAQDELIALGENLYGDKTPSGGYQREGFAEYLRFWLTRPDEVADAAPQFHRWFESEFAENNPEVWDALQSAREAATRWREQGAQERAREQQVETTTPAARLERAVTEIRDFFSYENFVEMGQPFYNLARQAEAQMGRELRPSENPYTLASALRTTQSARVKYMIEKGMIDVKGNRVGPSLEEIAGILGDYTIPEQYRGDFTTQELFKNYLWAKRARALWEDPEGQRNPGMSHEDALQIIGELESPRFEMAAEKLYEWQAGVLDYIAESSPTMAQMVERVRERDPGNYIPLQRVFQEGELADPVMGSSMSTSSPIQPLRGSGRPIKDPLQMAIANAENMVRAAHERMVVDAITNLASVEGMGHKIEEVEPDVIPATQRTIEQVIDQINRELTGDATVQFTGEDQELLQESIAFFSPKRHPNADEPIIPVWDGEAGQMRWFRVDEDLYGALETMDVYRLPKLVDMVLGVPTAFFRAGTTSLRASWGLIWNPIKDFQTFYANTQSSRGAFKLFGEWLSQIKSIALYKANRDQAAEWVDLYVRLGGEMAQPLGQDIPQTRRAAHRVVGDRSVLTLSQDFYDWYRDLVQLPELAPRAAELERVASEQLNWEPGEPLTLDQSLQLLTAGKQVTTDFTAAGKLGRKANRFMAFFNASIQGPRANVRALQRNPGRFAWKLIHLSMLSLWNWWEHKDEDWWQELSYRDRNMYWWFETDWPNETLIRIPKAFEIGALTSFPEALADAAYHNDPEAFTGWFETVFDIANPTNWEPTDPATLPALGGTLATVIGEQVHNERFFFDTPIVPRGQQRLPAEEQYSEYTTQASRFIGDLFNLSPRRIDHLREGLLGRFSTDILNIIPGLGQQFPEQEAEGADIPIFGRMFQRGGQFSNPKSVQDMYDLLEEAQKRQASERVEETEQERQLRLMLSDAAKATQALRWVAQHTDEFDRRRDLNEMIARIARDAVDRYESGDLRRVPFQKQRKEAEYMEEKMKRRRERGRP